MPVDNFDRVLPFVPETDDGDTFVYTEMLQRGQKKGNNGRRLLKTFYHRSRADFEKQYPDIKMLCDYSGTRACTRLAPRSFKTVAKQFLRLVTETYITENYAGMKTLYNRACGITKPIRKIWLCDIDGGQRPDVWAWLKNNNKDICIVPSKSGEHYMCDPFNVMTWPFPDIQIHKDNPTNLYIPDEAE